jgi:hypothetical protein
LRVIITKNISLNGMSINNADDTFKFINLELLPPIKYQSGSHFTKLLFNGELLRIQTPKCNTKNGVVKHGKKTLCDLIFDKSTEEFLFWIENLEAKCHQLIYEKSNLWFDTELELHDIESSFNSLIKPYKYGKCYSIRSDIKTTSAGKLALQVYHDNERDAMIEDITLETDIIAILEIEGIKFNSKNFFQLELNLCQIMIISPPVEKMLNKCLIKKEMINTYNVLPFQNKGDLVVLEVNSANPKTSSLAPPLEIEETPPDIRKNEYLDEETSLEEASLDQAIEESESGNTKIDEAKDQDKGITEVSFADLIVDDLENISIKSAEKIYYSLYQTALNKLKKAKEDVEIAYLEAKHLKKTYLLDDFDGSNNEIDKDLEMNV